MSLKPQPLPSFAHTTTLHHLVQPASSKMLPVRATNALLPEGATALEIPTDRPAFVDTFAGMRVPPAATAVRLVVPPSERPKGRPDMEYVTIRQSPEQSLYAKRFAYAYITPPEAPARSNACPFVRRVFRTLALDLPQTFEVFPQSRTGGYGDAALRFRTPAEREAAMRRHSFELDGATVTLLRDNEIVPNVPVPQAEIMVRVALHDYPVELRRTTEDIESSCRRFGFLREVDPACFAAPDLATVHAVFRLHHAREVPRELRIGYYDGSTSVIPVQIIRVWNSAHSYDASGRYVRLFQAPVAAA